MSSRRPRSLLYRLSKFSFEEPSRPAAFTMDLDSIEEQATVAAEAGDHRDLSEPDLVSPSPAVTFKQGKTRKVTITEHNRDADMGSASYVKTEEAYPKVAENGVMVKSAKLESGSSDSAGNISPGIAKGGDKHKKTCFCLPAVPAAVVTLILAIFLKGVIAVTYPGLTRPISKNFADLKWPDALVIRAVVLVSGFFAVCYLAGLFIVVKRYVRPIKFLVGLAAIDAFLTPVAYVLRILPITMEIAEDASDAYTQKEIAEISLLRGKVAISFGLLVISLAFNIFLLYALAQLRVVARKPTAAPSPATKPSYGKTAKTQETPTPRSSPFGRLRDAFTKNKVSGNNPDAAPQGPTDEAV